MALTLRQQIVLPTLVVAVLALALLVVLIGALSDIRRENELVREWTRSCERAEIALSSARGMQDALATPTLSPKQLEESHFNFLEQYWSFSQAVTSPEFVGRVPADKSAEIERYRLALDRFESERDIGAARQSLDWIVPQLAAQDRTFKTEKRNAYVRYYEIVNELTTRSFYLASAMVGLMAVLGGVLSLWATRSVSRRIESLRRQCGSDPSGDAGAAIKRDELDDLARCVTDMRRHVVSGLNSAKMLEVAEDERRRIAMDIHDQVLADLTHLSRDLKAARESNSPHILQSLEKGLDEIKSGIRAIMDDLHPQTLDMLGLEVALRSYIERKLARPGLPGFFLNVDEAVEPALTEFQKLALYRIAIEAINNAVSHAHCTRYEVECRLGDDAILLSVEDNGIGLANAGAVDTGRGLFNIEQRAKMIDATVRWLPARFSSGTRFELELPLTAGQEGPRA